MDDTPSTPMSLATEDSETLAKTAEQILAAAQKRREERIKHEELMAPIRKAETQLKQKLGRKLTNGEKNFIRLAHVSYSLWSLPLSSASTCLLRRRSHSHLRPR